MERKRKEYDEEGNVICEFMKDKGKIKEYNNGKILIDEGEYIHV